MKAVLTGGGTGGHLAVAAALCDALIAQGDEAIFIGSTGGQDRQWFEGGGGFSEVYFLETTGVVNRRGPAKVLALWRVMRALWRARGILKAYRPDAVISVGGYSAAPAALAALTLRLPLFIHEQNAVTGSLNRLLRPCARIFFSAYDPQSPVKQYPVKAVYFEKARQRSQVGTVVFLGGSQGAKAINDFALRVAPMLTAHGIHIIHQCGERDFKRVKAAYEALGITLELFSFSKNLPEWIAQSDLAVSRAGASTLWELVANGLPSMYIPYPYASGDHQYYNARYLSDRNLSWTVRESELSVAQFEGIVVQGCEEQSRGLLILEHGDAATKTILAIKENLTC